MDRRGELTELVALVTDSLGAANHAREVALPACRRAIRASGSSIRAVHRCDVAEAAALADDAEQAIREAQDALEPYPDVRFAGFLADAEKEFVEARLTAALIAGAPLPSAAELRVMGPSWLRGLAEAASELRRHLLDRLRNGELERGEELLAVMDDAYGALVEVDFPDAITHGLRRTLDALRAVLERTRGDVTTTVLQTRLRDSIERHQP